jgi:hypothetical protein
MYKAAPAETICLVPEPSSVGTKASSALGILPPEKRERYLELAFG